MSKIFYRNTLDGIFAAAITRKAQNFPTEAFNPLTDFITTPPAPDLVQPHEPIFFIGSSPKSPEDFRFFCSITANITWIDNSPEAFAPLSHEFANIPGQRATNNSISALTHLYCFPQRPTPPTITLLNQITGHASIPEAYLTHTYFQLGLQTSFLSPLNHTFTNLIFQSHHIIYDLINDLVAKGQPIYDFITTIVKDQLNPIPCTYNTHNALLFITPIPALSDITELLQTHPTPLAPRQIPTNTIIITAAPSPQPPHPWIYNISKIGLHALNLTKALEQFQPTGTHSIAHFTHQNDPITLFFPIPDLNTQPTEGITPITKRKYPK